MSAIDLAFEQNLLRQRADDKNKSTERIYAGKNRADRVGYGASVEKARIESDAKFYEQYIKALTVISEFDGKNPKHNVYKEGTSYFVRPRHESGEDSGLYATEPQEITSTEYMRLMQENSNTMATRKLVMQGYLGGKIKTTAEYDATEVARAKNKQFQDKSEGNAPPIDVDSDKDDNLTVSGYTIKDKVHEETGFTPDEFFVAENEKSNPFKLGFDPRHPISGLISRNKDYDPTLKPGSAQLQKISPNYPKQYMEGTSKGKKNIGNPKTDMLTRAKGGVTAGSMPTITFQKDVNSFKNLSDAQNANLMKQYKDAIANGKIMEGEEGIEVNSKGNLVFKQK